MLLYLPCGAETLPANLVSRTIGEAPVQFMLLIRAALFLLCKDHKKIFVKHIFSVFRGDVLLDGAEENVSGRAGLSSTGPCVSTCTHYTNSLFKVHNEVLRQFQWPKWVFTSDLYLLKRSVIVYFKIKLF